MARTGAWRGKGRGQAPRLIYRRFGREFLIGRTSPPHSGCDATQRSALPVVLRCRTFHLSSAPTVRPLGVPQQASHGGGGLRAELALAAAAGSALGVASPFRLQLLV